MGADNAIKKWLQPHWHLAGYATKAFIHVHSVYDDSQAYAEDSEELVKKVCMSGNVGPNSRGRLPGRL